MSTELELSEFLQNFSPISLHYSEPESYKHPWVFWSESEGCENSSSSADLGTPMIHDMIKSALCNTEPFWGFAQFWAPITTDGGRRLLSTSGQPFAVYRLRNDFAKYRLYSEKYRYNIDTNALDFEPEHMIFTLECSQSELVFFLICILSAILRADLDAFYAVDLIPYKTINGLDVTMGEIEEALKVVCESHNLALAQVWIPYEDKYNVPFLYSLEDTQTKRLLAIKLTGYLYADKKDGYDDFWLYFTSGDVTPHAIGEELPLVTLQDYKSRYISKLRSDKLIDCESGFYSPTSALAICLRSNGTGDFNYVFEFIWTKRSNRVIILEAILLTLKRCLPSFKFASGAEIGDEIDVILVEGSTDNEDNEIDETQTFRIFQEKRSSATLKAPGKGKNPMAMAVDLIAPSKVTCKTSPIVLSREVIEKQFGKTMKDAAKNLNVSLSSLKRKSREHGILKWPGPDFMKRNRNDSSIIQMNRNEEDNGAFDTSTVNPNKNMLTIKAEYVDDMIKFHLTVSQAIFVHVEKEIGKKFKLTDKTYKLKYLDEDGDWISLTSDVEMADCIKSSRKPDRTVVRVRVLPSPQQISNPSGSLGTFFI
ncbi:putative transcription factor Nin-like family [Helianthus annuus]|nr:putative transcription factor Nin-like family [Helianthus annuus]